MNPRPLKRPIEDVRTDFLVIGSGIAGLWTALRLSPVGHVVVVTKKDEVESNTNYAQGGIAAVVSQWDAIDKHIDDTLVVGAGLSKRRVVRRVVEEGPAMVRALIDIGVRFSFHGRRRTLANLDVGLEGGHSAARVVHASDLTGREIEAALVASLQECDTVDMLDHHLAVELIVDRGSSAPRCIGALILDRHRRVIERVLAPATILTTGGAGQIYRHTTNPAIATGDGMAMAYRAGCRVANMEFVQFHPTRLYAPGQKPFLISEAVRGAGGILRNVRGEAIMQGLHPLADLAPRDVVARAIVADCRRTRSRCAHLDITHLKPEFIKARFPNIYARCRSIGIDITRQPIPVLPAAHYMCGGVITDRNAQTDLTGLWAAGEVACTGLHGANRLASNSLLEAMVFATAAAESASRKLRRLENLLPRRVLAARIPAIGRMTDVRSSWRKLREVMWNNVGILRNKKELTTAISILRDLLKDAERRYWSNGINGETIEYRNAALVSLLVARAALARRESRGLHERTDYPLTDDENWRKDSVFQGPRI